MEEKKNNKRLIWLIVISIVLVLGLIGFIVYDKLFNIDKIISNNNSTTNTTQSITNEKVFKNYPINNDDDILSFDLHELYFNDIVDLSKNFKNLHLKKENLDYTLSCKEYYEENMEALGYACRRFEISINNVILDDAINEGCGHTKHIINNGEYLILQFSSGCDTGCGYIQIFKNGEDIYRVNGTSTYLNDSYENIIKYNDNKLYYFVQVKESNKSYNILKMIDFNEREIVEKEIERKEIETDAGAVCHDYSIEG